MTEWRRIEISTVGYGENRKRGITLEKIKISKKEKFHFLRVTSRVLCPNFKSLAQTVSPVAMTHTHTYSHRPNTEEILLYFWLFISKFGSKIGGFQLKKKVAQDTPRTNENVDVNQFVKTAFWGVFLRTTRQTNRKVRISFIRGTFSRWLYSNFFRCIILGYLSNNLFKEEEISLSGTFFLWYLLYINHCISD